MLPGNHDSVFFMENCVLEKIPLLKIEFLTGQEDLMINTKWNGSSESAFLKKFGSSDILIRSQES